MIVSLKTNIKILIQFSKRVLIFSSDFLLIIYYSFKNIIFKGILYEDDIVFITAAEKNYFPQAESLLKSFSKNLDNQLIFYDIGLENKQAHFLKENYQQVLFRTFDFSKHPKFISEYVDNKLGSYAWKPIIIDGVLKETKSKVVWLDAGNVVNKKIIFLKIALTATDLVVPTSSNTIQEWTHKKTIEIIGLDSKYLRSNNYASGLIGFNYNSQITQIISQEWKKYSSIQDCIAPKESSRDNHRQDQAVLTLLLYKHLFKNKIKKLTYLKSNFICGVLFHKKRIIDF